MFWLSIKLMTIVLLYMNDQMWPIGDCMGKSSGNEVGSIVHTTTLYLPPYIPAMQKCY